MNGWEREKAAGEVSPPSKTLTGPCTAPVLYQEVDGVRQAVSGHFVLEGNNQVGFQVGAYDPSRPLVIDPVLSYSTYLGGSNTDAGYAIAVDGSGNAYVTGGYTGTVTFGSTALTSRGGTEDVFVWKLDTNGNSTWAGSMGGNGNDVGTGIAVDGSGNLYVTGNWGQGSNNASNNNNFNPGPGAAV